MMMPSSDHDQLVNAAIIPFEPRKPKSSGATVTTIAALVAVDILHDRDESPEDKLLALIEATGEAEVLDADDAFGGFGSADTLPADTPHEPDNDNEGPVTG